MFECLVFGAGARHAPVHLQDSASRDSLLRCGGARGPGRKPDHQGAGGGVRTAGQPRRIRHPRRGSRRARTRTQQTVEVRILRPKRRAMSLRGREHYSVRHRYPMQDRKPRGFYGGRPVEIYDAPCSITATALNASSSLRCWLASHSVSPHYQAIYSSSSS